MQGERTYVGLGWAQKYMWTCVPLGLLVDYFLFGLIEIVLTKCCVYIYMRCSFVATNKSYRVFIMLVSKRFDNLVKEDHNLSKNVVFV